MITNNKLILTKKLSYAFFVIVSLLSSAQASSSSKDEVWDLGSYQRKTQKFLIVRKALHSADFIKDLEENARRDLGNLRIAVEKEKLDFSTFFKKLYQCFSCESETEKDAIEKSVNDSRSSKDKALSNLSSRLKERMKQESMEADQDLKLSMAIAKTIKIF